MWPVRDLPPFLNLPSRSIWEHHLNVAERGWNDALCPLKIARVRLSEDGLRALPSGETLKTEASYHLYRPAAYEREPNRRFPVVVSAAFLRWQSTLMRPFRRARFPRR